MTQATTTIKNATGQVRRSIHDQILADAQALQVLSAQLRNEEADDRKRMRTYLADLQQVLNLDAYAGASWNFFYITHMQAPSPWDHLGEQMVSSSPPS